MAAFEARNAARSALGTTMVYVPSANEFPRSVEMSMESLPAPPVVLPPEGGPKFRMSTGSNLCFIRYRF
jgi:hypothetical protein